MGLHSQLSGPLEKMGNEEGTRSDVLIVASSSHSPELSFFFTRIAESPTDRKFPLSLASTLAWILKCWRLHSPALKGSFFREILGVLCGHQHKPYQRKICRARSRSPSAAHVKPNVREGLCADPKASGVTVPTESQVLGGVGIQLCGPLLLGHLPAGNCLLLSTYLFLHCQKILN